MAEKFIGTGLDALVQGIGGTSEYGILNNVKVSTKCDVETVKGEGLDVIGKIVSGEEFTVSAELLMKASAPALAMGDVIEMPLDDSNKVKFIVTGADKGYEKGKVATYSISGEGADTIVYPVAP